MLPSCNPTDFCKALMNLEDDGYEIFHIEPIKDGTEYLVYIRKPRVVPGAAYIITRDCGEMFRKGDLFAGMPNGMLEHLRSGVKIEFTMEWKDLILMYKEG